jgi:hypothetical protein
MKANGNNLQELLDLRQTMILEGKMNGIDHINRLIHKLELKSFFEDTSATGGPSGAVTGSTVGGGGVAYSNAGIGGMGAVVAPQPSIFAGSTGGGAFQAGGGSSGSGDIAFPFPALGGKKMYQKAPVPDREHGSKVGKKRRKDQTNLKKLKSLFNRDLNKDLKKPGKVMSFEEYEKDLLNRVTKSN